MPKNSWIACTIIAIVVLCACVICLVVSLAVVAGYLYVAPVITVSVPFQPAQTSAPTPLVIRPTAQAVDLSPANPDETPQSQLITPTPTPSLEPEPASVPTDSLKNLQDTIIPISDPIEAAHRLLNLDNVSATSEAGAVPYTIGTEQSFWIGNGEVEDFRVQARLSYITEHAYFWIEDGIRYREQELIDLAEAFENQIYPTDHRYFGTEWNPGVDNDPHVYILYARGIGDGIAGYYSSADEYPRLVNQYSNVHEMFVFNADNSPLDDDYTYGVLAHELQHMIHWYQDRNEVNWLSEGFSELAVLLNNFSPGGFDSIYTSDPDLQLNNWPDDSQEDTTAHYGSSFLFVTYFLDRFGEAAMKALVANPDNDLAGVDSTLQQINAIDPLNGKPISADDFFIDWAITNYLMDSTVGDGRYAYTSNVDTAPAPPTQTVKKCPLVSTTSEVHQYGVDYLRFTCPGSHTIHFEGSIQTPLLPQDPHSGKYAMWSNKSDESDMSLSQTFDLTNTTGPVFLNYWTWYDLENGWDYLYLEASTDGENWHILTTPSGTSLNPQGNSYGWGYTGSSGGGKRPVWIRESVDISSYAGQQLTLRYEYITDSNVTGEGFMLDDLSIPQIGYTSDFETDDGGWQADGWVRIQNVLPQSYRLALITFGDTTQVQYITLNPDVSADIPFTIGEGVHEVVLVTTGTTRFTRQLAPYRFSVSTP